MLASVVGSAVALVAVAGYAAADVFDVAPGVLTLDRPVAVPTPTVSGTPAPVALPEPAASVDPMLSDTGANAPAPTSAGLQRALTTASDDPALKGGTGISVRDGLTGEELWALDAGTPRVPASTQKLLAALAVADGLDLADRMTTSVVARAGSTDVVIRSARSSPSATASAASSFWVEAGTRGVPASRAHSSSPVMPSRTLMPVRPSAPGRRMPWSAPAAGRRGWARARRRRCR